MNRLQLELDRLYGLDARPADGDALAQSRRGVRVLVLELALPADWERLSAVWKGAQQDLDLPAPAIAVSGIDGLQLWFSLASPVSQSAGASFLEGLRARYLSDIASTKVRLIAKPAELPAAPPVESGPDRWSAFVTPDLASVFADTPWLDIPPGDDGQATLLRALQPIRPAAFEAASERLGTVADDSNGHPAPPTPPGTPAVPAADIHDTDPARFLTGVMNDETVPLALRIEAAKALLPYAMRLQVDGEASMTSRHSREARSCRSS